MKPKFQLFFPKLDLLIITGLFCFFLRLQGFSQKEASFNMLKDDITSYLPSLDVLIDSAISNDPSIRFRNQQLIVNHSKLRTSQTRWSNNIGVQADVRYGTFDNFSTNTAAGQSPSIVATATTQTNFGVGAYIKFPVFDLVDRRNQIKLARTEIDQAQSMADQQTKEVRERVITQYNELVKKQNLLKILSRYLETSRLNLQMAEKEFINGTIPVTEFARITDIVTRSETDFEILRMDFRTAYMVLEEITGIKLHIVK